MRVVVGVLALLAIMPASAHAGNVTIASGVLTYTGTDADADAIQFRRTGNDIEISSPGTTPLTESAASCNPSSPGLVVCPGVAGPPENVIRVVAVGLGGNDDFQFSDLGSTIT